MARRNELKHAKARQEKRQQTIGEFDESLKAMCNEAERLDMTDPHAVESVLGAEAMLKRAMIGFKRLSGDKDRGERQRLSQRTTPELPPNLRKV